ncbi:MAG: GxGYxYP family putative glycoside hydrolase [Acidimicrobiales bacterium]
MTAPRAGRRGRAGPGCVAAVVVLVTTLALATGATPTPTAAAASTPGSCQVPGAVADCYLARRPSLGPVTVADVSGATSGQRLLATTLQGVVNRTTARLYLVGVRSPSEDQFWIDDYVRRGLVDVVATGDLTAALDAFAAEASGYVIASETEPWTVNTATTVAAATGGVVATPELVPDLQARGLTQIDDHRGRWPDAPTAYESIAAAYHDQLAYPGMAIQQPGNHQPRDFFVQQGIMTVFTRPSRSDFDRVYALLDRYPNDHPVYGYVSDTGVEEVQAVARLAQAGRFLVPTDTTDNLSLHIAVGASAPRATAPPADAPTVAPCTTDQTNVVLAISDGDNLAVAEGTYPRSSSWSSPRRGELPLGWSIGPSASVLMPSVWDHYASTATPNDEIVGMMGLGYTYTSLLPNGADYFAASFALDAALGIDTHWSLDALLTQPDAPGWSLVHTGIARAGVKPQGMLLNYLDFGGPDWHRTVDGVPVLTSRQSAYEDGPAELAAQIQALIDTPAPERPLVTFFAVTVWNSSYDALADAMAPLTARGVRFLTPSEAFACLPAPPPTSPTTAPPTSTPDPGGPGTGDGSDIVVTPRFTA